ncbi:MAG TPA: hypothetical protein VGK57_13055, partial [Candidatus Binatia bacterium]
MAIAEVGGNHPSAAISSTLIGRIGHIIRSLKETRHREGWVSAPFPSQHRVTLEWRRAMKSGYRRACVC